VERVTPISKESTHSFTKPEGHSKRMCNVTHKSLPAKKKDGVTHMLVRYLLVGIQIRDLKSSISLGEYGGVHVVEELASSRTS